MICGFIGQILLHVNRTPTISLAQWEQNTGALDTIAVYVQYVDDGPAWHSTTLN